jgi:hypothetical protein
MNRKFYAAEFRKDLSVVLRRKMIGFEIQQKFFARHTRTIRQKSASKTLGLNRRVSNRQQGDLYVYSLTYVTHRIRLHLKNTVTPASLQAHKTPDSKEASAVKCGMLELMDDAEIDRLRKAICRSFNSSPHKKKYWLALLEMRVAAEKTGQRGARTPSNESSLRGPSANSR